MDPAHSPSIPLPVHEFPDGPVLLGDWRSTYHSAILGQMLLRRTGPAESIVSRMHDLHVSQIRWYSTKVPLDPSGNRRLRTFELASGSQWESPPPDHPFSTSSSAVPDADGRLAGPYSPVAEHEHHYMVAEISLAHSSPSSSGNLRPAAVLGYLRIEGTCRSDMLLSDPAPSSTSAPSPPPPFQHRSPRRPTLPPSRLSTSGLNVYTSPVDADYLRARISSVTSGATTSRRQRSDSSRPRTPPLPISGLSISPFASADGVLSPSTDMETTPIARRRRTSGTEDTPTRGYSIDNNNKASVDAARVTRPSSFIGDATTPTLTQEPCSIDPGSDFAMNATAPNVTGRLDLSYLNKRPSSSPLFISPFGSRSNSVGRSSTGMSQGTGPNSRSNSSNDTSFTTSSSRSLSSAGLVFSENPLNHGTSLSGAPEETRFVLMYLGSHVKAFPTAEHPSSEDCVLEMSFPSTQDVGDKGPKGFLTLRDMTILADIIEHSLKTKDHRESTTTTSASDSSSESAESDAGSETSEIAIATSTLPTCCCEFYKRLFALIPMVSGLRAASEHQNRQRDGSHYERFSHHGRYLRTPFEEQEDHTESELDADSTLALSLKTKFERKRARCDRELLRTAKSVNRNATSTAVPAPKATTYVPGSTVSPTTDTRALALEEARRATELFSRAMRHNEDSWDSPPGASRDNDHDTGAESDEV